MGQRSYIVNGMVYMNVKDEVLRRLSELGFQLVVDAGDGRNDAVVQAPGSRADLLLQIKAGETENWHALNVERGRQPAILGRRHVTPGMAERYRKAGINYIDTGGNASIRLPGVFVRVEGRRPTVTREPGRDRHSRALTAAGLRVSFVILVSEELGSKGTQRELAHAARVSLGSVHSALSDLTAQGLISENQNKRTIDRPALTEQWVQSYEATLLPKLQSASLRGPEPSWWIDRDARVGEDGELSGEAALQMQGYGLRATTTTIYGDPPWTELRRQARLNRPVTGEAPNVELREKFWSLGVDGGATVPGLLVYADAIATGDSRQRQAATEYWESNDELRRVSGR